MIHREESDSPTKERLLGSDPADGSSRKPSRKERSDWREVVRAWGIGVRRRVV